LPVVKHLDIFADGQSGVGAGGFNRSSQHL
jgi:hypothetical protein